MYAYPLWRRAPFIALLIVVLVIGYSPAITHGTSTIRLAVLSSSSVANHVYVKASSVSLHRQGFLFLNNTGWTTLSQAFPVIDLVSSASQALAPTLSSASVHSGRYDAVRIFFANSTVVISGSGTPVPPPAPIALNMTLRVSPNGDSDLLLQVTFDYASFFENPPSLSIVVVRASAS